jgi:hypothetical protein
MVLGQCDDQFIVPDTVCFETLSYGRQFDDSRLECSLEEKFDLRHLTIIS